MKQQFSLSEGLTILNKDPLTSTDHWGNIETLQELFIYTYIYIYIYIWYLLSLTYISFIRPHLDYGDAIFHQAYKPFAWKLTISPVQCFISYNLSDKRYFKAKTLTRTSFRISSAQALVSQTLHFLLEF